MMSFDEKILNGMGVLAAIVDTGSFARAAETLNMSQSGISRSIARLEARLGIRLLDRTTRSVALTDEGRRFYEQVIPLLRGLEEAAATASGSTTMIRGRLRVNVDPFFSSLILGPRLGTFIDDHPQLQLELATRDRLGDMVADGFDLAIRFDEPRMSNLVARKLLETRIVTVAAPSYIKRHGRPQTPQELAGHVCIEFRNPETGRPFVWEFYRQGERVAINTRGRLTVNDVQTMLSVCLAGYGVAQIMELGAEAMLAKGRFIDLFPDWRDDRFPLFAVYPSRHYLPAKTRAFLDFVISIAPSAGMIFPIG